LIDDLFPHFTQQKHALHKNLQGLLVFRSDLAVDHFKDLLRVVCLHSNDLLAISGDLKVYLKQFKYGFQTSFGELVILVQGVCYGLA
jgi:hypothetical protein